MRRKIIQQGNQAYTITLPVKWIREKGLRNRDEVDLEMIENHILIKSEKKHLENKKIEIEFFESDILKTKKPYRNIQRIYSALFKAGYDEIVFRTKIKKIIDFLKERTNLFIGYEIVEEGRNFLKIQSVTNPKKEDFKPLLLRSFHIITTISEETISRIKKKDFKLNDLTELEKTNGKLTDYLKRLLAKIDISETSNSRYYYSLIAEIERLCDEYKYLDQEIIKNKKITSQDIRILEEIDGILRITIKLFDKYDPEILKQISDARERIIEQINYDKKKKRNQIYYSESQKNIIIKIYEMCECLIEMNL